MRRNRLGLILHGVAVGYTKGRVFGSLSGLLLGLVCASATPAQVSNSAADPVSVQRETFIRAWEAARRGDSATFESEQQSLKDYLLYPYLEYNALLSARSSAAPQRMAEFLEQHEHWAFTAALERAWLRTMGKRARWDVLLQYAEGHPDTEVRCYRGDARIKRDQTEGLMAEAQSLWLAGQSQPEACDPLFEWLIAKGGVTPALAWQRINLAFDARHPHLVRYLKRFLDPAEQPWADRWLQQDSQRYGRLDRATQWPDTPEGRDLTSYGLKRLARSDGDRAWQYFLKLDGHFQWREAQRAAILREIALWSAVEAKQGVFERMYAVPAAYRDGTLLEWWARAGLAAEVWQQVEIAVSQMESELRTDDRWRFWGARAAMANGHRERGETELDRLANRPTYYGFLAADHLDRPYAICPATPEVPPDAIRLLRGRPDIARALELERVNLDNWSRAEWTLALRRLQSGDLRAAAALAIEAGWVDIAIMALADSGDFDWYEWRFPIAHLEAVERTTATRNLDPGWVMGLMRSESAMAEDAVSGAGARGLMQIMPGTARQLSRRHGFSYSGVHQLLQADFNIELGTTYLRELLDKYGDNSVLASGAYNAGPGAVERWLGRGHPPEAAMWVETLPYRETREYIPRVLAFTAIYDWRLARPVTRVSSRMPPLDSVNMISPNIDTQIIPKTAEVVCPGQADVGAP